MQKGSLLSAPVHDTCPSPEPGESSLHPSYFMQVNFNIILQFTPVSSMWSVSFKFPHQEMCTILFFSSMHATCSTYCILINLIIQIIFGEDYKSWRCSLWTLLKFPFSPFLLDSTIFLKHSGLEHWQPVFFTKCDKLCFTCVKIIVPYVLILMFLG
jgi:hypothetical protein